MSLRTIRKEKHHWYPLKLLKKGHATLNINLSANEPTQRSVCPSGPISQLLTWGARRGSVRCFCSSVPGPGWTWWARCPGAARVAGCAPAGSGTDREERKHVVKSLQGWLECWRDPLQLWIHGKLKQRLIWNNYLLLISQDSLGYKICQFIYRITVVKWCASGCGDAMCWLQHEVV